MSYKKPIKHPKIISRMFSSTSNFDIKDDRNIYLSVNEGEQIIIYEALRIPPGYFYAGSDKNMGLIPFSAIEITEESFNPYIFLLNILHSNDYFLLKLIFPILNRPEKFTKLILLGLLRCNMLFDAIEVLLKEEIIKTDKNVIFRDTSLVLSIIKNVIQTPKLRKFRENVVKSLVLDLVKSPKYYTTEHGWENRLVNLISNFINNLIGQSWPDALHCIIKSIKKAINDTELRYRIINSVLFLYFLTPEIIHPVFLKNINELTNTQQKALILCGKILQAIANNTTFEKNSPYVYLNSHIKKWRANIVRLLSIILRLKIRKDSEFNVIKITKSQMINIMVNIHFLICQKKQDILDVMNKNSSLYVEFIKVLSELGNPAEKLVPFENSNVRMNSPIISVLKRREKYISNIVQKNISYKKINYKI